MSETKYTVDYFIAKFERIPEDDWCMHFFVTPDKRHKCAFGHCGIRNTESFVRRTYINSEAEALDELFKSCGMDVITVNNDEDAIFTGGTIKSRILRALQHIKKRKEAVKV